MPITATLFAAIIPMLTYMIVLWRMDKYEREPLLAVLLHFLWGAIGAVLLGILGTQFVISQISNIVDPDKLSFYQTIIIAPVVEEIVKGLFLLRTFRTRRFDNMTDGLVYGGAIGLGFGMTENFMYFVAYGNTPESWISIVLIRSCFSAVMHGISTASLGAMIGIAKFSHPSKKILLAFSGLLIAILIHLLWNLSVSFKLTILLGFIYMLGLILFFIILFSLSLKNERKLIYNELQSETIIPKAHLTILSSPLRNKKNWVPENIRKDYIRAATKIAFRKAEMKHAEEKSYYESEINTYRNKVFELLKKIS